VQPYQNQILVILKGEKDKRVPSSPAVIYYHLLKQQSVKTKLYVYDCGHNFGSIEYSLDVTVNFTSWFDQHL
jgi:dipeptidyl aminopeptidase/acylaminoacyl peptidase